MNPISVGDNTNKKKELQQLLVDTLLNALEEEKITVTEMREASNYILENMESIATPFEYVEFLDKLTQKWNVFNDALKQYKDQMHQDHEKLVMDKLSSFIGKVN
jgi:hypothetical protein